MGLSLRAFGYRLGLSFLIVKYGGSLLWGAMVYLLVAAALPRQKTAIVWLLANGLAIAVELSRLVHTPGLDAFRETMAGALLLGRVFSLLNILAYTLGIALAVLITQWLYGKVCKGHLKDQSGSSQHQ
ncbi:DUF2809 domain-containing protein [Rhizobium oryziradicis]|nr:DUF2809 domain-containing protein [Rhizobium oryziradicis]